MVVFPVAPIPPPRGGICSFSSFGVDLGVFPIKAFRLGSSSCLFYGLIYLKFHLVTISAFWGHSDECQDAGAMSLGPMDLSLRPVCPGG